MKKYYLLLLCLFIGFQVHAQSQKKKNIEQQKANYIIQKLELTSAESKKFMPIFKDYQKEISALRREGAIKKIESEDISNFTDAQILALVDYKLLYEEKMLSIRTKYHAKFKEVLPIRKVATLYQAESDFKRQLLERMTEKNK